MDAKHYNLGRLSATSVYCFLWFLVIFSYG